MGIEITWLYFALTGAVLGFIRLPLFRRLDAPPRTSVRFGTLDGLRGFLALSVFAFHLVITREFIASGTWQVPASRFYGLLGPLGVSLFFMITGFLFWNKLLAVKGAADWRDLYLGRLFRIAPMYLFAVLAMLLVVFARSGFTLAEPPGKVAWSIAQWLALGIGNLKPDVNGEVASLVLARVTWTISYEWMFYASLLGTAYFARGRGHLAFVTVALVLALAGKSLLHIAVYGFAALFLCGMLVASLLHERIVPRLSDAVASTLALGSLVLIFVAALLTARVDGYGTPALIALTAFFYLVASGSSLFGLLNTRAARRLGSISYSVYLLQGLALALVYWNAPVREFALSNVTHYWLVGLGCTAALIVAAALTYSYIELPGIRHGRSYLRRQSVPAAAATSGAAELRDLNPS